MVDFPSGAVLITGGAGGIGLATARVLVEEGTPVVLADRDGERVAREAAAFRPVPVDARSVDVLDTAAVESMVGDVAASSGLRGVVNAAGILQVGTIEDVSERDWDRVLGVNLRGTFAVCKAALPWLVKRGGGAIVNVSSIGGRTKSAHGAPSYVASKAGVIGLTMSLAAQNAAHGVRVNCVAPGVIDTDMTAVLTAEQRAASVASIPLGRLGDPSDVAYVIAALLSDRWRYVTGQTINVNGGMFMQ